VGPRRRRALSEGARRPRVAVNRVVVLQAQFPLQRLPLADLAGPLEEKPGLNSPSTPSWVLVSRANRMPPAAHHQGLPGRGRGAEFLPCRRSGMGSGQLDWCVRTAQGLRPCPHPEAFGALAECDRQVTVPASQASWKKLGALLLQRRLMAPPWRLWWAARPQPACNWRCPAARRSRAKRSPCSTQLVTARGAPLRIVAALTQPDPRWLLGEPLLEAQGEAGTWLWIARAAGIGKPEADLRDAQTDPRPARQLFFWPCWAQLLEIEASLKLGAQPGGPPSVRWLLAAAR